MCSQGWKYHAEKLNDLEDWTYRIEANLMYLCVWSCTFTLLTRSPALLKGQPKEEEKYLNVFVDSEIMWKWNCVTQYL